MEAFLVVAEEVLREMASKRDKGDKKVLMELGLVKEMTGRLSSHKIDKRWVKLLGEQSTTGE